MRTLIALLIVSTVACGCGEGAASTTHAARARTRRSLAAGI